MFYVCQLSVAVTKYTREKCFKGVQRFFRVFGFQGFTLWTTEPIDVGMFGGGASWQLG